MDYSPLRHFLYSQQLFTALRMTIGTVVPALVLVLGFNLTGPGLACAIGTICVCLIDLPGELRSKHREMLVTALLVVITAALTTLAQAYVILLYPMVLLVSFCGSFAAAFGNKASIIGINAVLVMALGLSQRSAVVDNGPYLAGLTFGAFWYVYYCLAVCRLFKYQMARRALSECLFATAAYLDKHSKCYDSAIPLEQCYQLLLDQQARLQEAQQKARDLVLNTQLNHAATLQNDPYTKLFNLLIDAIDLHHAVLAAHADLTLLRGQAYHSENLLFMRDLLSKSARELTRIAQAVVGGRRPHLQESTNAAWRSLAYDLEKSRLSGLPNMQPQTYAALMTSQEHARRIIDSVNKMHQDTTSTTNTTRFTVQSVVQQCYTEATIFTLPTAAYYSLAWRYALRFTLAMLAALACGALLRSNHDNWILLTVLVALRPGFGQSRQRSRQRLLGTLAGCGAATLLLITTQHNNLLFAVMILSLLLSFSLIQLHYLSSVFFISLVVMVAYHLLAPSELHLIRERVIATVIGAAIAATATHLLPFWEFQRIKPQLNILKQHSLHYLDSILQSTADNDLAYRATKRDMLAALAALSNSYQCMRLEPASKRVAEKEVNALRLSYHLFIAQMAAIYYRLMTQPALRHTPTIAAALLRARETLQHSPGVVLPTEDDERTAHIDHILAALLHTTTEISRLTHHILHTNVYC